jgi:ankyrin repeat protein
MFVKPARGMFEAVRGGDLAAVRAALAAGGDPNAADEEGMTPFLAAVSQSRLAEKDGDRVRAAALEEIVALLRSNGGDETSLVALDLVEAAERGELDRVRSLLRKGADPNRRVGRWPIESAAEDGHTDVVAALIEAGAEVDVAGKKGTPLQRAAQKGHHEVLVKLIEAGAELQPALRHIVWAATSAPPHIVKRLLEAGANPNFETYAGTPLYVASKLGRLEIVELLLEHGADRDTGSIVGNPLSAAVEAGHAEIVRVLLRAGAKLPLAYQRKPLLHLAADRADSKVLDALLEGGDEIDRRGSLTTELTRATALIVAAARGHAAIVRRLLDRGADKDAVDDSGWTALRHAKDAGHEEVVEILRGAGASKSAALPSTSSLMLAAESGDLEGVRAALRAGAEVDARDDREKSRGRTALMLAASGGHAEVVEALLSAGADPDLTEPEGVPARDRVFMKDAPRKRAAIHFAASEGHEAVVRELLEQDATVDLRDVDQRSALAEAIAGDHEAVVSLLRDAGAAPVAFRVEVAPFVEPKAKKAKPIKKKPASKKKAPAKKKATAKKKAPAKKKATPKKTPPRKKGSPRR